MTSRIGFSVAITIAVLCALTSSSGCARNSAKRSDAKSADSTTGRNYDSPQAAYSAVEAGYEREDWQAVLDAMTIETQEAVIENVLSGMVLVASFNQPSQQKFGALLEKHGIDLAEASRSVPKPGESAPGKRSFVDPKLAKSIQDKAGFLTEAMNMAQPEDRTSPFGGATLTDVAIRGDTATGMLVLIVPNNAPLKRPVEFRKVDGRWLLHHVEASAAAGEKSQIIVPPGLN